MAGGLWLVGAILAASGSIASNLGVNMQKYSFILNNKLPKQKQKLKTRQPKWLLGMALVILGSIGDFAALSLAAQSVVAPIGSVTLVANVFFAHYWLKESLSWIELAGTGLIVSGSVLAVAFGDHGDTNYNIHDILRFFYGTTFIIYAVLSIALSLALYKFQHPITPMKQKIVDATRRYEAAYDSNDSAAMEYEDFFIASLQKDYKKHQKYHPFSLCALSGILGGQSVMFGKMVGELISATFDGDNQFFSPFLYLFILCMLLCVMGQLHYLAVALNFFDALYVVPVFQCFFISFSTLGGASFFNEFADFDATQGILFPLGLFTTLTGVVVLSRRKMSDGSDNRKRLAEIGNDSSSMEIIEEGDEEEEIHVNGDEDEIDGQSDTEHSRAHALSLLEKKRHRFRRMRKRRLRKLGYEGLSEDEESDHPDGEEDEFNEDEFFDSDEEINHEQLHEQNGSFTAPTIEMEAISHTHQHQHHQQPHSHNNEKTPTRKHSEEKKEELNPILSARHSPIHPTFEHGQHRRRSSASSTPTPAHSSLFDDFGAAIIASAGSSPGQSPRPSPEALAPDGRRSSITSVTGTPQGRRRSLDRRSTLPYRGQPSRVPPALILSPENESISAPTTPTSLAFMPSILRAMSSTPSSASTPSMGPSASPPSSAETPSFLQPSTSTYIPPTAPVTLFGKETTIDEKVKKYSSLPYHAQGLVGMPLASALGHFITVMKEDRNNERKEREEKDQNNSSAIEAADSNSLTIDVNDSENNLTIPVAEALNTSSSGIDGNLLSVNAAAANSRSSSTEPSVGASSHAHHPSMSIIDAVKAFGSNIGEKIRHALTDKDSADNKENDPTIVTSDETIIDDHQQQQQQSNTEVETSLATSDIAPNNSNQSSESENRSESSIITNTEDATNSNHPDLVVEPQVSESSVNHSSLVNESQSDPSSMNSSLISNIARDGEDSLNDSSLDDDLHLDEDDSEGEEGL